MNSRTLLERAAKAAGLWDFKNNCIDVPWSPLTDDGDALRLAVKLGLTVYAPEKTVTGVWVCVVHGYGPDAVEAWEKVESGPYAATRLAIVRAAASLAKD